jgi:hypothetical protein
VGWMAEGTVLVWVATRMRTALMRALAAGALTLGLISLAMDATIAQTRVLWNTRLLSFAVSIAAMAISTALIRGEANREASRAEVSREEVNREEANREGAAKSAGPWRLLAQAGAVMTRALVMVAVLLEIHTYWWSSVAPAVGMPDLRSSGSLLSSAIWLMVASGVIVWMATRGKAIALQATVHRVEGACWFAAGLLTLTIGMFYSQHQVIWNLRFAAFAVAIACVAWAGRQARTESSIESQFRIGTSVLVTLLMLTAVCFEISTFWSTRQLAAAPGSMMYGSQVTGRHMAERFSYSAWFLLAGAVLLALGFQRQSALLRWQGLVLLAVTIIKVFLLDTSTLSPGYRIISFLALGALLLAVSFAYQRDWLHLRAAGANAGGTK